ncbi:MAG: TIGR01244 family sulfur transferase [Pseudomonadota bacterium]
MAFLAWDVTDMMRLEGLITRLPNRRFKGSSMDIRHLTSDFAVSPQIAPDDVQTLKDAGFTTIICNRPDHEVTPDISSEAIRTAAEAAGLRFVLNPVDGAAMTLDNVEAQGAAAGDGPVFAYCRSGTRSSIVWAMSQAGKMDTDDILGACAAGGYDLGHLRGQIDALASR